jgi:hypothetical protein
MACLIKPPQGQSKGCVSFTTPERDLVIRKDAAALAAVEALKRRFIVGLHHNWHDSDFVYDPLFDFSMAGDGDLVPRNGAPFPRISLDCCNFVPEYFFAPRNPEPFWDVINVTRDAYFKGQPEFYQAIRALYDRGEKLRVLHLCPVPRPKQGEDPAPPLRRLHESLFSREERRLFTLMTMDWDHPFPLDLESLAFFYRSSRVFLHTAPDERRCRIASYSWANRMPVVARDNVASILPREFHKPPFYFGYDQDSRLPDAILAAVRSSHHHADWDAVVEHFRPANAAVRLSQFLDGLAASRGETMSPLPVNPGHMDFRLGRHHIESQRDPNRLSQTVAEFSAELLRRSDEDLAAISELDYPEEALLPAAAPAAAPSARMGTQAARPAVKPPSLGARLRTWLRQGHTLPLTRYRVTVDVMRDPKP